LKLEREQWIGHWKEISDYLLPRRGRFLTDQANRGKKLNSYIIDSSGTFALRTLSAGLMGGLTSPARPWFRLTTEDIELREFGPVKLWLHDLKLRMEQVFSTSNLYQVLPALYEEVASYGIGSMIVFEDMYKVIRCMAFPIGSYHVANSPDGQVDTLYREFQMTTDQMVKQFGADKVSRRVKSAYDKGQTEDWIDVVHLIEPNDDRIPDAADALNMPWRSAWFERAEQDQAFLRESGFPEFPAMCPRWWLNGEDIYGRSVGMDALGDIKQLQHEQKRKSQAIDKAVNPPMTAPSALKEGGAGSISTLPGGVTYVDSPTGQPGFRPAYEVNPQVLNRREEIAEIQRRISRAFYEDIFLMFANTDRREITAREIDAKDEEKRLQLGPVLERLQNELLDPLIDRTFAIMERNDLIPPAPQELQGQPLKIEYISILAQAQKRVGTDVVDRLLMMLSVIAPLKPEALDKVNWDELIEEAAEMLGTPPSIIASDDEVKAIRAARAQQMRMQQNLEMGLAAAEGAKTLSETDVNKESGLTRLNEIAKQRAAAIQQPGS
jgi:hypothetical protein